MGYFLFGRDWKTPVLLTDGSRENGKCCSFVSYHCCVYMVWPPVT